MILSLMVGFAACGGGDGKDNAATIEAAREKMDQIESVHYEMTMELGMSAAGESFNVNTAQIADYIIDPMTMKMDMNMDLGMLGGMDMQMYATEKDGAYCLYTGIDDGTGNVAWSGQTMDLSELKQYDAAETMKLYLNSGADFKEAGTETINGEKATRYDGVVKGDDIESVLNASGVLDQLTEMQLITSDVASMLSDIGDLPLSIWVSDDSSLPVRYEMDMAEMMQTMMDNMAEETGETITIDKASIAMTLSNFNSVEDIVIPDEVLNAAVA